MGNGYDDITRFDDTETPLAGAATFTGTARDTLGKGRFIVNVFADQAGNLFTEQSDDGSTAWRRSAATAIVANTDLSVTVTPTRKFIRVIVVNGATPQTVLEVDSALAE